jgi:hypothetical protein
MAEDIAAAYWTEAAERKRLMHGTREERLEYQTRSFPVEEALSGRIDAGDLTLVDDMVLIAQAAPDEDARGLFGAGALWELLYNGGDAFAEPLEQAAKRSPEFAGALRAAFAGWEGIKPETKQRLRPILEP